MVSGDSELEKKYRKRGVVMLIFNPKGEILTIKENNNVDVTHKISGELGIPCETSESGEFWHETVIRGLNEELGLTVENLQSLLLFDTKGSDLGETLFVPGVLAKVVGMYCGDPERLEEVIARSQKDGEVEFIGWSEIDNLVSGDNTRLGVKNVLCAFKKTPIYNDFCNLYNYNRLWKSVRKEDLPLGGDDAFYGG